MCSLGVNDWIFTVFVNFSDGMVVGVAIHSSGMLQNGSGGGREREQNVLVKLFRFRLSIKTSTISTSYSSAEMTPCQFISSNFVHFCVMPS